MGEGRKLQQIPSAPSRPPAPRSALPGETKGRSGTHPRRGSVSAGLGRRCVAARREELNSRVIKGSENAGDRKKTRRDKTGENKTRQKAARPEGWSKTNRSKSK